MQPPPQGTPSTLPPLSDGPGSLTSPSRPEFTGSGDEYFRIWIVNVLLTLLTFGVYSAWAKVRREQYFHRNTLLAGATFDYDAAPIAILRGRIVALLLFGGLQLAGLVSPIAAGLAAIAFTAAVPWLITAALRFRLRHTLHRGLRFGFRGRVGEAARAFLLWPLLTPLSLGALLPLALQRQQRFLYGHSAYGGTPFEMELSAGSVYRVCLGALGVGACAGVLGAALLVGASYLLPEPNGARGTAMGIALPVTFFGAFLVAGAFVQVRLQNLIWSGLRLGPHRFGCDQTLRSYLGLQLGNILGLVLTLGFFQPWAAVRSARYRSDHFALIPGASLDAFVAGAAEAKSATGDEMADLFGFDVGL